MPTAPTIENRHRGYPEWLDRATAHYTAMTTNALAERLREETGRFTAWDNAERDVIISVLNVRHPEIDAATRRHYSMADPYQVSTAHAAASTVVLAVIDTLPSEDD